MEPVKVYFSDLRADEISTLEKLHRLMKAAGFEQIDFKDKYVAIKLHFGEPGNIDRKSTRLNSSHSGESRMPSSA